MLSPLINDKPVEVGFSLSEVKGLKADNIKAGYKPESSAPTIIIDPYKNQNWTFCRISKVISFPMM